jgi:hypothetical protein
VETHLCWPQAVQEVVTQLLHKSVAADRPISLTQGLYRIWGVARRDQVSRWSAGKARHWDRAVAGSSALRAAILRQTRLEIASSQSFAWGQILWDVEKLYDHIQMAQVVEVALSDGVEYPLIPLVLGLMMHSAPRRVSTDTAVSEKLWPLRSLIAGCGQSIDYSRLALWRILERTHADYRPRQLETWVDDLHHLELSYAVEVEAKLIDVSVGLATELHRQGFRLSAKSAVVSSPPKLAKRVAEALLQHGIRLQALAPKTWVWQPMGRDDQQRSSRGA